MNLRKSVFNPQLQSLINEGNCIVTKKMKIMRVESICNKGIKAHLSRSLFLVEGFITHDGHSTDYSSMSS